MEAPNRNFITIPTTIRPSGLTIVCLSDTHGQLHKIPDIPPGDIVVHTGDASRRGEKKELTNFYKCYGRLEHPVKLFIAGNHELTLDQAHLHFQRTCLDIVRSDKCEIGVIRYLEDEECVIHVEDPDVRVKFYGSPWQPKHFEMAFNLRRGIALREKWERIPFDTDVLLTHSPPKDILDESESGTKCGCEELKRFHDEKIINPRLHVFGHIHEQHGFQQRDNVLFVNAASCDIGYKPVNTPIVVFLPFDKNLPAEVVSEE